jgi:Subtilase family
VNSDIEPFEKKPEALEAGQPIDRFQFSIGAAVLAGVSLLGVACGSRPQPATASETWVEAPPEGEVCLRKDTLPVRVIVVDNFWQADKNTTHGEIVEAELMRNHRAEGEEADVTLERVHVSLWGGDHAIKEGKPGALESYLRDHFAGRMARDAEGLQSIIDSDGPRGVIHQSQGASQSRAVDALYYRALREGDFGEALQTQLGLSATPLDTRQQKKLLMESLVQAADAMHGKDEVVKEAREHLRGIQEQLHQKGFIHVVSAGNQGYLARDMQSLGVSAPAGFFTNDFASPYSIIVAAADNGSKDVHGERYRVANLASPSAGAHIAADGVDRPLLVDGENGHHSGSSYAAPQGSSTIVDLMKANLDITWEETLEQLQKSATPVPGAQNFLGAGVLGQPGMLLCDTPPAG